MEHVTISQQVKTTKGTFFMKERFKNIEFLRIIGCFAVIFYHLFMKNNGILGVGADIEILDKFTKMTRHGNMAVELFFIISGLFFALNLDTTKSLWKFLKKKLIRLYPVFIVMLLIGYLGHSLLGLYKLKIYQSILCLFGFNGTILANGMGWQTGVNTGWYVSTMLWTFLLFYYLLKNYEKKTVDLIIAILIYCSYGMLIHYSTGTTWGANKYFTLFINSGMCRAIGGIGVGYFIAQWYNQNKETIKNTVLPIYTKLFLTVIEFMCLFFIINNLLLHKIKYDNNFIFIVVFVITIMLFLSNQGFISKFLNKDVFVNLSKYTYSIYMLHCYIIYMLRNYFWNIHKHFLEIHPIVNISIAVFLSIFFGVIMYHLVERPASKYLKKFI